MAFINTIHPLEAPYAYSQKEMVEWILSEFDEESKRKFTWLLTHAGIEKRQSVLPDFSERNGVPLLYRRRNVGIEERMHLFEEVGVDWLEQHAASFWHKSKVEKKEISHLITVSCTGLSAPGLDFKMQQILGLGADICRLSVNFMGCYAAFHALKMANWICAAEPLAKVLIVDIELCALHYQSGEALDQVLANGLFADGAAFVLVSNEPKGFEMKQFFQSTAAQSAQEMAWELSPEAFKMKLSTYVPKVIESGIEAFVRENIKDEIDHYAVHPGGLKILEAFEQALALKKGSIDESYSVLRAYGNMSSVSIFYVLEQIAKTKTGRICATAFGPGLTFEGAYFQL
ncbi:type III polyketide synthase [Marinilongibacter aquaticus]|uniref:type III polyketide synthase n=1 Tax=Marinilongibacter aquaticus TaxID=2975157 RepID=UPI0021BD5626|nr:type III polyketide synthase [Marinilongibacter aquaticus]UBM57890.1 type III polyketide synthase [Marinilongibacter aquaticus]